MSQKKLTAKSALCRAFLDGYVLNVRNCFDIIGYSNLPREASRMVEQSFGITLTRTRMNGKSRYGQPITWFNYHLKKHSKANKEGVKKMKEYLKQIK